VPTLWALPPSLAYQPADRELRPRRGLAWSRQALADCQHYQPRSQHRERPRCSARNSCQHALQNGVPNDVTVGLVLSTHSLFEKLPVDWVFLGSHYVFFTQPSRYTRQMHLSVVPKAAHIPQNQENLDSGHAALVCAQLWFYAQSISSLTTERNRRASCHPLTAYFRPATAT
jgi:hypothetical protein